MQERPALLRAIAATIETDFAVHAADVHALGGEFDQTFAAVIAGHDGQIAHPDLRKHDLVVGVIE